MEPVSEDIQHLVSELDRGRQAWISGRPEHAGTAHMVQAEDMTIFGPFGGEAAWGGPDLELRQARAASRFHGGSGTCELVKAIAAGDLLVLVMVERNEVTFEGRTEPHPWILRTTQVFRREGDRWIRLHRHADPLIKFRSLDDTLVLLAPGKPAV
jgi:ketosteroid isomerase-like protein